MADGGLVHKPDRRDPVQLDLLALALHINRERAVPRVDESLDPVAVAKDDRVSVTAACVLRRRIELHPRDAIHWHIDEPERRMLPPHCVAPFAIDESSESPHKDLAIAQVHRCDWNARGGRWVDHSSKRECSGEDICGRLVPNGS